MTARIFFGIRISFVFVVKFPKCSLEILPELTFKILKGNSLEIFSRYVQGNA